MISATIFIFCGVASWVVLKGIFGKQKFIEFPCLTAIAYLGYLGIQMYSLRDDKTIPESHFLLAIAMCLACMCAGFWGYHLGRHWKKESQTPVVYDPDSLFRCSLILIGIGYSGVVSMARYFGGFKNQFLDGAHYRQEWSGSVMFFNTLSKQVYPGIFMLFFSLLKKRNMKRIILFGFSMLFPLAVIFILGRRNVAIGLFFSLLSIYYYVKHKFLNPFLLLGASFVGVMLIVLMPLYRDYITNIKSTSGSIYMAVMDDYQSKNSSNAEMRACIAYVGYCRELSVYTYGINLLDCFSSNFVPRALVGDNVKNNLFFNAEQDVTNAIYQVSGYEKDLSSFKTGPGSAFMMFDFIGAFFFLILGFIYRVIWDRGFEGGDERYMLFYAFTVALIPLFVCFSVENVIVLFFINSLLFAISNFYCKKNTFPAII